MKKYIAALLCSMSLVPATRAQQAWPVLKHYEKEATDRIAMPVGGIGTGNISIGGNGQWKDVEMMNKPGIGFYGSTTPKQAPLFMVYTEDASGKKVSRALVGPIPPYEYAGSEGSTAPNHGFPRFASASFDAAYPFAVVNLEDAEMPVSAKVKVFNPFIPADADASGIPVAVVRYALTNKTDKPLTVAVAGSLDNFIGMDGFKVEFNSFNRAIVPQGAKDNRNTFRKTDRLAGIYMTSDSVDKDASTWGTIALTTSALDPQYRVSYRTAFNPKGWNANMNDMWMDFADDGVFKDITFDKQEDSPRAGLAVKLSLGANETKEVQFLLTWRFPNRKDWDDKQTVGNYYTTRYADAWDVAEKTLIALPDLERKTLEFVTLFLQSDYPDVVKEAALFNTSTLRSQTAFRTRDGNFFGWEGVFASTGSCYGNCTHVWNYEHATPFLFGALAKKMREVEYTYGLWEDTGLMSFRVSLPLEKNKSWKAAAADGQMGTVMKVYREWQLSGDDAFLKNVYPGVKKALAFAWIKGGWDADKDGVMEGCQHNTMDIEYYGPNPEIEFWYLGALRAAAEMANYMKDKAFETTCRQLFTRGSEWTDAHLFNGEFYIHQIQPVASKEAIAPGLLIGMGSKDLKNPDFQIGEGCLVDQLVGQNMAHICGLGYLAKPEHVKKTLQSIRRYNYVKTFGDHFNNMRSYALGDEAGLMLTAYPDPAKRPAIPLSYWSEAWTGLEYTAATGMLYEGMRDEAISTITDVRDRFNGVKRNPFNEEECGNHYARAMASWSAVVALSGFHYSAPAAKFTITSTPGNYFWSNGYSWGMAHVTHEGPAVKVAIDVHHGTLNLKTVAVKEGESSLRKMLALTEGSSQTITIGRKQE
jgi:non-lysosomal glucosylceramidase